MTIKRKELGIFGEKVAGEYLHEQGYKILEKNFTCPLGEIDLIAEDDDTIVFVEVRTRSTDKFGTAVESIDRRKKLRLLKLANYYISKKKLKNCSGRFDVVAVKVFESNNYKISLYKNAFTANI